MRLSLSEFKRAIKRGIICFSSEHKSLISNKIKEKFLKKRTIQKMYKNYLKCLKDYDLWRTRFENFPFLGTIIVGKRECTLQADIWNGRVGSIIIWVAKRYCIITKPGRSLGK